MVSFYEELTVLRYRHITLVSQLREIFILVINHLFFRVYQTKIANFIDTDGSYSSSKNIDEYVNSVLPEIAKQLNVSAELEKIDAVWFCIDGSTEQIQANRNYIKNLGENTLLIVTKTEQIPQEKIEPVMNTLLELTKRDQLIMVSAQQQNGLNNLIGKTQKICKKSMPNVADAIKEWEKKWEDHYAPIRKKWSECVSAEADSYIHWAAGRAATIALIPFPLADVAPLVANEIYMIYRLAGIYGIAVDNTVITMLLGCAGGSFIGKVGASFLPFLKIPIAAAVTFGVGKAAKAYFESNMTLSVQQLKENFRMGKKEAKKIEWKQGEDK